MDLDRVLNSAVETGGLNREEIVHLLSLTDEEEISRLLHAADEVRTRFCGDEVHLRGLIEFSNICARNCAYCGLRRDNRQVRRYRMSPQQIVQAAVEVAKRGIGTVVLQSGEDPWFTAERMADIVRAIKAEAGCAITLSIGERPYDEYRVMREAGADRYLLRHETANPKVYAHIRPDMRYEERVRCLRDLRALGYQVGAGCMVGIPGQTVEDLADDVLFLRDLDADMIGIGPFIPHPNTPFGDQPGGTIPMTLNMLAVTRIVTRNAHMPATTAVGSVDSFGREKALMAGANVIMPNSTPMEYRVEYEIYPNKEGMTDDPVTSLDSLREKIESIGRSIAEGPGHSLKRR